VEFKKRVRGVTDEAMKRLQMCGWRGNIRELRNAMERAMLLVDATRSPLISFQSSPVRRA
jgi:two-component system, NtrC family, response regulator AtoC